MIMSNTSNYENNNPLTEVALALAMAFFSIMILSIYSLSNASLNNKKQISITETSFEKNKNKDNRITIYFYQNSFYDEFFKKIENISTIKKNKFLLFISTDITVEKLFSIKSLTKSKDVKISKMSENIKDKLKLKSERRDK
tara:strand:+ start:94 stop:516 length:423 start_codon:yes stop_codon:yes gene_type:complete